MQAQNKKVARNQAHASNHPGHHDTQGDRNQLRAADAACCAAARLLLPFTRRIGLQRDSRSRTGTGCCCSTWDAASHQLCWETRAEAMDQHHSSRCARLTHMRMHEHERMHAQGSASGCLPLPLHLTKMMSLRNSSRSHNRGTRPSSRLLRHTEAMLPARHSTPLPRAHSFESKMTPVTLQHRRPTCGMRPCVHHNRACQVLQG